MSTGLPQTSESQSSPGRKIRISYFEANGKAGECLVQRNSVNVMANEVFVTAATIAIGPALIWLIVTYSPFNVRPFNSLHDIRFYWDVVLFAAITLPIVTLAFLTLIHLGVFVELTFAWTFNAFHVQEAPREINRALLRWDEHHLWLPGYVVRRSVKSRASEASDTQRDLQPFDVYAYKIPLEELRGVRRHSFRISWLQRVGVYLIMPLTPRHARRLIYRTSLDCVTTHGSIQRQVDLAHGSIQYQADLDQAELEWLITWMNQKWNLQLLPAIDTVRGDPWPSPYVTWPAGDVGHSHAAAKVGLRMFILCLIFVMLTTLLMWGNFLPEPDNSRFFMTVVVMEGIVLLWAIWKQRPDAESELEKRYRSVYRIEK